MVHREGHAAAVPDLAAGRRGHARRAELGVARVRDARGVLAAPRGVDQPQDPGDDRDQRPRVRGIPRGRAGHARRQVGVHGARRRAGSDAPDPRSTRRHRRGHPDHREVHGQEPQGLARARPHRDVGDARPVARGGDRVHLGLGQRRSALPDPHDGGAARVGALLDRAERHPDHGDPAPRVVAVAGALQGLLRSAVRGGGQESARHGAGRSSVYFWRPAPDQVLRGGLGLHEEAEGGLADHRRGDLRVVQEASLVNPGSRGRHRKGMPARRAAREVDPPGYPRDLIRTVLVDWGATLRIRPIRPDDEAGLRAFFTRLSTRTVFQRFFRAWRQLPDEWYPRFVQVDYAQRLALIAEVDGADGARLLGVARYEPTDTDGVAEVALVVEDSWQGQGLGRRLLEAILDAAATRGIHRFRADALSDNRRILRLLAETVSIESSSTEQGVTELTFVRRPRGPSDDDYFRGATTTSVGEPLR